MYETIFVKKPKLLAATCNLLAEQNLVHLGRFVHFNQKVFGVTLTLKGLRGGHFDPPQVFSGQLENELRFFNEILAIPSL